MSEQIRMVRADGAHANVLVPDDEAQWRGWGFMLPAELAAINAAAAKATAPAAGDEAKPADSAKPKRKAKAAADGASADVDG